MVGIADVYVSHNLNNIQELKKSATGDPRTGVVQFVAAGLLHVA